MTVETSARKQNFSGGQGTLTFTFRTLVNTPENIKVSETLISTGAVTELTYGVDYTVSVNSDGVGGTVTVSPTYSTAYTQTVYRLTEAVQESDYDDFNQFPANTLEENLDQLTMIAQEQQENADRTLRYPISSSGASVDLPSPEAGTYLSWNDTADGLVNRDLPDPSTLVKATGADAAAGTNDTNYMTPAKVKTEVENPGTVSIPMINLTGALPTAKGGTAADLSAAVRGSIPFFSATGTMSTIAPTTSGFVVISQGTGADVKFENLQNLGIFNTSTGHDHDGSDSKKVLVTNLDVTGLTPTNGTGFLSVSGSSILVQTISTTGLSNVIFSYSGQINSSGTLRGLFSGTTLIPTGGTLNYSFWVTNQTTYDTVIQTKWKKIAGVSTVTVYAAIWQAESGASHSGACQVVIGSASGAVVGTANQVTPEWKNFTIDVSGLTNGTVYDVSIQIKLDPTGAAAYLGSIIAFGS